MGPFETILLLVLLIVGFLVWRAVQRANAAKALATAREDYELMLSKLKKKPTSPELKQAALNAGRHYASLARASNGTTIFDEMMLKNDLDAASAGAVAAPVDVVAPAAPAPVSVEQRLAQLDALRAKGIVTDDEYATRRQKILDEL